VAIVLLAWTIAILVLARRLPLTATVVAASVGGLVIGFGLLWAAIVGTQLATCRPPTCTTADPATDVLYALAFLVPVIALAGAEIGLRVWLSRHRVGTRG
jgi:formate/nitrite transporter FocA (FNT family)